MTPAELEEQQRRLGQGNLPPPPPVQSYSAPRTAGTAYGVPGVNSGPTNVGGVGSLPVPAPVQAPAAVPVRRVAPMANTPAAQSIAAAPAPNSLGVTATNEFETPQQRQARELQLRAANEAIATIEGRTPSVAQLQLQQGLQRAAAQQQSQAAGARGMGVAGARRLAARNIAELQQGTAGQTAQLRAQEIAGARESLAQIAGQVRGQDIDTTSQGASAIDRAKKLSMDFQVAMQDLQLREKLGILSDERERVHLAEMTRHNQEAERLELMGRHNEAQRLREEMGARNREFWGSILGSVAGIGAAAAGAR